MKKILVLLLLLFPYLSLAGNSPVRPKGSGSAEDPYLIDRIENLVWFRENSSECADKHFKMTADIDASETRGWNGARGFLPLGHFNGTFDGGGHYISNLYIATSSEPAALFTSLGKKTPFPFPFTTNSYEETLESVKIDTCVKDLAILNCMFSSDKTACGLAKTISLSKITDVLITGTLQSKLKEGGLALNCSNSFIEGCAFDITHRNNYCIAGGIFLKADNVYIKNCLLLGDFEFVGESPEIERSKPNQHALVKSFGGKPKPKKPAKDYDIVCVSKGEFRLENCLMLTKLFSSKKDRNVHYFPNEKSINSFYSTDNVKKNWHSGEKTGLYNERLLKKETYKSWDFDSVWEIEDGKSFPKLRKLEKMMKRE